MLAKFVSMRFGPLGGPEQTRLFAVPSAVNDGALGFPALFEEFAECARLLHEGDRARDRILSSIDPGIVMIATDDPLVGIGGARDLDNDIVKSLSVPVGLHS